MNSTGIPSITQAISEDDGRVTRPWYLWFQKQSTIGGSGSTGGTYTQDDYEKMTYTQIQNAGLLPKLLSEGKKDLLEKKAKEQLVLNRTQPARGARIPARLAQALQKHA